MYGNPYVNTYNPQVTKDRIDQQIAQLQQMKEQLPQQTQMQPITQNFQIAPSNSSSIRYANSIDDVNKEMVFADTPFFSKDMSVVWIKNGKNEITPYSLTKIVQKDEKDLQIEYLLAQIEELKKGINSNATKSNNNDGDEPIESEKSSNVSNGKSRNAK